MSDAEIMQQADKALRELEQDINNYHPLAWAIPWGPDAIDKMEGIISFYQQRKKDWLRMLSGASEIAGKILLEFMRLADLEIEGAESVLFMLNRSNQAKN